MDEQINNLFSCINKIKEEIEEIKIKNNNMEENIKKVKSILNRIENRCKIIDIQICNRDKLLIELTKETAKLRNVIEKELNDKINILFDIKEIQNEKFYNLKYELNLVKKELKYYKKDFNSTK